LLCRAWLNLVYGRASKLNVHSLMRSGSDVIVALCAWIVIFEKGIRSSVVSSGMSSAMGLDLGFSR
jgi:hypothetical protein